MMQIEQVCHRGGEWTSPLPGSLGDRADLVFVFGGTAPIRERALFEQIRGAYPRAHLFGCSTAGEICGTQVSDDGVVVTAVDFEHTRIEGTSINVREVNDSQTIGERLARSLDPNGLVHALVLSDGQLINGSELVKGLTKHLPANVTVTGGLSGDGERFRETYVFSDRPPESGAVAILGLYGDRLRIGCGSLGGWDPFGPERLITKSKGNVLYELDGKSALELYKRYLGEHAEGLPATGLLFPLCLRTPDGEMTGVVRTILAVDEQAETMTFAGDVPEGAYARLMKANFDRLIDGAVGAARRSHQALGSSSPDLALLISCVGRKMVLRQRIEEEVEGVRDVLGQKTILTGFYSYGEISPFTPSAKCELHNQTMTITTLSEV
jgi:hypothetical protein